MGSADELVDQGERLVDRLRSLSEVRLLRARDGLSVADSAYALAQVLDDLGADLDGRDRRDLPRLQPQASGDQVAVTLHALERSIEDSPDGDRAASVALAAVRALRDQIDG